MNLDSDESKTRLDMSISDGEVSLSPKKEISDEKKRDTTWYYLGAVGQIGFAVSIPIVIGIVVGTFIDKRFGWYPKGTLSSTFLGLGVSMMYLVSVVRMVR